MEELDLKDILNTFWNKRVIIILIILILTILGVIYTIGFTSPVYSSSTTLVLATSSATTATNTTITTTDLTLNSKLVSTYSELIKSKNIIRQVIENLDINLTEESIRNNVKVTSKTNTDVIEITVVNSNPEYSARIANEIAKVFIQKVKELYNIENIQVVDKAEIQTEPSNINHKKDVIMFAGMGCIISALYVIVSTMMDTTIKNADELEKRYKLTVLATIPVCENALQKRKGGRK